MKKRFSARYLFEQSSIRFKSRSSVVLAGALAAAFPEFSQQQLRNPVFFVGCGRSGTSLLQHLLKAHRDIAVYPTEANELWFPQTYPWRSAKIDVPVFWDDPYGFTEISLKQSSPSYERHLQAVFGAYQFMARGQAFLNKSVMVTFMIPRMLQIFPEARFIHIVRDGRAVVLSYAKWESKKIAANLARYQAGGYDFNLETLLEKFTKHWQDHLQEIARQNKALQLEEKGRLFEIRYEDFCTDPGTHLRQLAVFIGVNPNRYGPLDLTQVKSQDYKFKSQLDDDSLRRITALMQPTLNQRGYVALSDKLS